MKRRGKRIHECYVTRFLPRRKDQKRIIRRDIDYVISIETIRFDNDPNKRNNASRLEAQFKRVCFVFSGLGRLELLTAELGSLAGRGERELAS